MESKELITYEMFEKKISKYIKDKKQLTIIEDAYHFAALKHCGQKRLTGEDYIYHLIAVADILADFGADTPSLAAALLHDINIECNVDFKDIKENFGEEVTYLVEGITKINKLNFGSASEAVLQNQRKILVGLTEDVRVIILKLADRLHNMRTLWILSDKKQKEKAKETLDILVPIAHRLGMNKIKAELEDLSLRYYKPDIYFDIIEKLNQTKNERDNLVLEMQRSVSEILTKNEIKHEIKGRAKSLFSIYKKLDAGRKFSDIYDLLALRIYVDTEAECYQAIGLIHAKYKPLPKRFKDYIAMPKTNMYQSLHTTVFGLEGHLYEIQVRTYEMDKIAEHGIASHWSYKEKKKATLQNEMEQKLQFFRSIIELKNENDEANFIETANEELFKDKVYVFTPKGDVVELPKGSTPIDFAYKVHSRVGDKTVGAIVNNTIVPLDYVLSDNDIVKINTNKNSAGPSKEWINIAKTTQAKNKIKAFFNKIDKNEYAKKGEALLLKNLRKKKIIINDFLNDENIEKILTEHHLGDMNELYIALGSNKIPISKIINSFLNENDTKEEIILRKTQNNKELPNILLKKDIIVEETCDIKVNIAACCKPLPGDRIIGYITKGYGITVHRMMCPNVRELEERFIGVKWNDIIYNKYPTSIIIYTNGHRNILLDIISKTSNTDITIQSINTISQNDSTLYEITVLSENKDKLIKFMDQIKGITDVIDVERTFK